MSNEETITTSVTAASASPIDPIIVINRNPEIRFSRRIFIHPQRGIRVKMAAIDAVVKPPHQPESEEEEGQIVDDEDDQSEKIPAEQ